MGKALQIRVSAVTWNEDLLEKLWPKLTELAFSVPIKHEKHGVLEMVKALDEGLQFLDFVLAALLLVVHQALHHLGGFIPEVVVTGIQLDLAVVDVCCMSTYFI